MIVDSSVWIDYFNGIDYSKTDRLDTALYDGEVELLDIVLIEVLQGFKSDKHYSTAKKLLTKLPIYTSIDAKQAISSAENFRTLRKQGITIRKTIDVIIATYCINNSKELLASDKNFEWIASVLPLNLIP